MYIIDSHTACDKKVTTLKKYFRQYPLFTYNQSICLKIPHRLVVSLSSPSHLENFSLHTKMTIFSMTWWLSLGLISDVCDFSRFLTGV